MDSETPEDVTTGPAPARPPARDEYATFLRSMSQVDWLALLVVGLYLLVDLAPLQQPVLAVATMLVFGGFVLVLRWRRFPLRSARGRIALDVAVTILFISLVATQAGGASSLLVNLYLLPIVLAGVALGPRGTLVAFLAVAFAWGSLLALSGELSQPLPGLLARVFGQLAPFALVAYLTQRLAGAILSARRRIAEMAERDGLTGLINLRSFKDLLAREHAARSSAGNGGYAVLMVDMDRLKHVNDTWGHEAGNAAILHVTEAIKRAVRASDVAARYGGDEFTVFLPDATPEVAAVVAQRIRNAVYKSLFQPGGRAQRVTVSVGVGCYPQDGSGALDAVKAADRRMYKDKTLRRATGEATEPAPGRD